MKWGSLTWELEDEGGYSASEALEDEGCKGNRGVQLGMVERWRGQGPQR